jgi:hypothetical protein
MTKKKIFKKAAPKCKADLKKKATKKTQIPIQETGGDYTIYLNKKAWKITSKALNITLSSHQASFTANALAKQIQRGNGKIKLALWYSPDKANEYSPSKYPLHIFPIKNKKTKTKRRNSRK